MLAQKPCFASEGVQTPSSSIISHCSFRNTHYRNSTALNNGQEQLRHEHRRTFVSSDSSSVLFCDPTANVSSPASSLRRSQPSAAVRTYQTSSTTLPQRHKSPTFLTQQTATLSPRPRVSSPLNYTPQSGRGNYQRKLKPAESTTASSDASAQCAFFHDTWKPKLWNTKLNDNARPLEHTRNTAQYNDDTYLTPRRETFENESTVDSRRSSRSKLSPQRTADSETSSSCNHDDLLVGNATVMLPTACPKTKCLEQKPSNCSRLLAANVRRLGETSPNYEHTAGRPKDELQAPHSTSNPYCVFYGVIDSQLEKLCREVVIHRSLQDAQAPHHCSAGTEGGSIAPGKEGAQDPSPTHEKKRNRVIFCLVCKQFKPRSTRARFQSCNHIACYDCVRIALHVEFWVGSVPANVLYSAVYSAARVRKSALSELFFSVLQAVKTNLSITNAPRAVCPVCCAPLDWSSIKPYIVLAEEAKYCPVLTLAFAGKDIPPNTPSRHISRTVPPMPLGARCLSAADAEPPDMFTRQQMDQFLTEKDDKRRIESEVDKEVEAQKRLEKAKDIVALFFPKGVDMDLLVSETHYAQTSPGKCVTLLFGLKRLGASQTYIDPFEQWRKQFLHS